MIAFYFFASALILILIVLLLKKGKRAVRVATPEPKKIEEPEEKRITWNEVVARTDLIGGEFESHEDLKVYRGPIVGIERGTYCIYLNIGWVAKRDGDGLAWAYDKISEEDPNTQKWQKHSYSQSLTLHTHGLCQPYLRKDGSVIAYLFLTGHLILYPKGCIKLDPKLVEGLQINTTTT